MKWRIWAALFYKTWTVSYLKNKWDRETGNGAGKEILVSSRRFRMADGGRDESFWKSVLNWVAFNETYEQQQAIIFLDARLTSVNRGRSNDTLWMGYPTIAGLLCAVIKTLIFA